MTTIQQLAAASCSFLFAARPLAHNRPPLCGMIYLGAAAPVLHTAPQWPDLRRIQARDTASIPFIHSTLTTFSGREGEHSLSQVHCILLPEIADEEVHMLFDAAYRELTMDRLHDVSQYILPRGRFAESIGTCHLLEETQVFVDTEVFSRLALSR